jgi:two-component system, cell cycle response regulator DivK
MPGHDPLIVRRNVLIVEDNPLNMKLFEAIVASQGWHVLQATDGPQALKLAHAHRPDLIIMDIGLPGISGLAVAQSLKAADDTHDIPIIMTTAYEQQDLDNDLRNSGCDEFMSKPIAVDAFRCLCKSLIERSAR